ncbi:MAG: formyltransferase family protein [Rubripirellula sp.]|nr:formyltransferase family protein [Rubripirellula sp.]
MRILLFLEESAGVQTLRAAHASEHEVVAVLTSLHRTTSNRLGATVQGVAEHLKVPVWAAEQVKDPSFAERVLHESIDLILNVHSLHIVHKEVLSAARVGGFNLHTGPLPGYAGMNAVNWAIMNGETQHGATLHWMEAGIDTGDIAFETMFELSPQDTGLSVSRRCARDGLQLIKQLLATQPDAIPRKPQDLSARRYHGFEIPFKGQIPWASADLIERFVRACNFHPLPSPWGIPTVDFRGESIGLIEVAVTTEHCDTEPGSIHPREGSCYLAAADYWVEVKRILHRNHLAAPHEVLAN